jgi:hypothetical protein
MKTVDNSTIDEVLKNTEFEYLIEKFQSSGDTNLRNLTLLNNQGQLLSYLKNFEDDNIKVLRLHSLLKQKMIESSKPFLKTLVIWVSVLFFIIILFLFFVISKLF